MCGCHVSLPHPSKLSCASLGYVILALLHHVHSITASDLGINKFSKRLLKPNYIPNNELLDFISRLPSDEELVSVHLSMGDLLSYLSQQLMHKELRPHLLSRKKKPIKGSTKPS